MMKDYLDELIEESCKDPDFDREWMAAEARSALVVVRTEANLTQAEVAKRMGVARPRVSELESKPLSVSFGRMLAYAGALGVPIETIARSIHAAK